MILVMPGPVTSYRTDIIKHLNFSTGSLTEDFDITVQIHRQHLGKIKYIPDAINYTQDPKQIGDFYKQTLRWYRGWFQGVVRYKLGLGMQLIDLNFMFQIFEVMGLGALIYLAAQTAMGASPFDTSATRIFVADFLITCVFAVFCALLTRRLRILFVLPIVFVLRLVEVCIYIQAFTEIIILRKFQNRKEVGWQVAGRRYALTADALEKL
jgi:cellulose synthase/poly-beta-1,6-N-acetylglucosamine synthase-like glycosyltransferase